MIRKALVILGMTLALLLTSVSTGNQPQAQAGECTVSVINLCGKIKNIGSIPVRLIQGWPNVYGVNLQPGESSQRYYRDTDGVYIYYGYRARLCSYDGFGGVYCKWYGPGAVKITDNMTTWTVEVRRA